MAGLEQIGWIADALAAAEAGRLMPRSFTEQGGAAAFNRLSSDPEVPHTTVTLRLATPGFGTRTVVGALQQAAAFPALMALANDDPLAAAIDAVYNAAIVHGDDRDHFLTDPRAGGGPSRSYSEIITTGSAAHRSGERIGRQGRVASPGG
ncbi:hypothetical protein ACFHW0_26170 [Micromonospora sp. LOL_025]|uniref:hypothetical protein n=1 Tax=Micromonospora sp. LOL_025 TaxID=3345413 RepID=UPI003A87D5A8